MTSASPRVGLYDDPLFRAHDAGPGHPERPERLDALRRGLRASGLEDALVACPPRAAAHDELLRVHTEPHVAAVRATRGRTVRFDPDTQAGPRSYEAALLAAGSVADAVERVLDGRLDRAFCSVRPPGHHAEAARAMGFCLFNNVALGAAHALARGTRRVAVIDFDVHHGNGTQEAFYDDPRVLYVSSHAHPFYPGTGYASEVGRGEGRGFTVNLPLPFGCGDGEYARVYREVVVPVVAAYGPELLLVSVGFDPHRDDPLAPMRVTARGFAELAAACLDAARGRPAVFVLEGGYDLAGIADSAANVVGVLCGGAADPVARPRGGPIDAVLESFRRELQPYWPAL
jgi:acetoin utilization deacetylase AcuC-like enzyme